MFYLAALLRDITKFDWLLILFMCGLESDSVLLTSDNFADFIF